MTKAIEVRNSAFDPAQLPGPIFVVQKHSASTLHYDFRLQVGDVLKSWAIPKGPSLDPADKRLAVRVEDHALEYATFEGVIPEGEYGAGTVLLWDIGWWELEDYQAEDHKELSGRTNHNATGDQSEAATVEQALARGEIKFVLHGQKLKGSWTLVKMKGRGENNWLLIKHRDDAARPGSNVVDEEPRSVLSGRTLEEIEGKGPSLSVSREGNTALFRLGEKEVVLTHLDRVYFPEAGLTKGDLVRYYLAVSPYLLPHLRERPLTLERWPEGLEDGSFYQKDAGPYFPEWLKTFPVVRKDQKKTVHYPVVQDEADLLYLVNLGTITFHSQMSRIINYDRPDLMVVDIDPPEFEISPTELADAGSAPLPVETAHPTLPQAAAVALLVRDHLRELGFDPLVKTSGKRGVHMAFRLDQERDFENARSWLQEVFLELAAKHPQLLTTEIRKNKRKGRVYLDALRMSRGATIVPPYVARATPEATVSMPVTWEELASLPDARVFTIKTAIDRLKQTGDLWEVLA